MKTEISDCRPFTFAQNAKVGHLYELQEYPDVILMRVSNKNIPVKEKECMCPFLICRNGGFNLYEIGEIALWNSMIPMVHLGEAIIKNF